MWARRFFTIYTYIRIYIFRRERVIIIISGYGIFFIYIARLYICTKMIIIIIINKRDKAAVVSRTQFFFSHIVFNLDLSQWKVNWYVQEFPILSRVISFLFEGEGNRREKALKKITTVESKPKPTTTVTIREWLMVSSFIFSALYYNKLLSFCGRGEKNISQSR